MVGLPEYFSDLFENNGYGPKILPERYVPGGRLKLTQDTTYYLRSGGSDLADGLTEATAFASMDRLLDQINYVDGCGFALTLDIGAGTWTRTGTNPTIHIGLGENEGFVPVGLQSLTLNGASYASTIIDGTGKNSCIGINYCLECLVYVQNLKLSGSTSAQLYVTQGLAYVNNVEFGACSGYQISAAFLSNLFAQDYRISGSAVRHLVVAYSSAAYVSGSTTLTGTPAFSYTFISADQCAAITYTGTFSGTATGTRYIVNQCSSISTQGKGTSYFPGSSAGSVNSGSQYT